MSALDEVFPDEDFRFHLTLRRGELRDFLRTQDVTGRVLAERRRWIHEAPERYTALRPAAVPVFEEFDRWIAAEFGERCETMGALGGRFEPVGKDFDGATIQVPAGADDVPGISEALENAKQKAAEKPAEKPAA